MTRFLVTYHAGSMALDRESVAAARAEFTEWAGLVGAALCDAGEPLRSAMVISRNGVRDGWLADPLVGWSVIEAADHDAAARLLMNHPFVSRGCLVQIGQPV